MKLSAEDLWSLFSSNYSFWFTHLLAQFWSPTSLSVLFVSVSLRLWREYFIRLFFLHYKETSNLQQWELCTHWQMFVLKCLKITWRVLLCLMMLFQTRLSTQDPLRAADTFSESDVTRHSFSVNMAHFPSKCHTDSLSLFGCFGQSGWCCFLFSPFCGLLSPPSSCCSLLQRWMSTGFLFSDVFCNSSLCSICLSDRSRLKSSSYILSWWEKHTRFQWQTHL